MEFITQGILINDVHVCLVCIITYFHFFVVITVFLHNSFAAWSQFPKVFYQTIICSSSLSTWSSQPCTSIFSFLVFFLFKKYQQVRPIKQLIQPRYQRKRVQRGHLKAKVIPTTWSLMIQVCCVLPLSILHCFIFVWMHIIYEVALIQHIISTLLNLQGPY